MAEKPDPLDDPGRLKELEEIILATQDSTEEFDKLARVAATALKTPISLITFVEADGQTFKGEYGLPATLAEIRTMPISHSICAFIIRDPKPLVIRDAAVHPLLMEHPSVLEMGIRSYLGIPLMRHKGPAFGSLSFVDFTPREWTPEEISAAESLAGCVLKLIEAALRRYRKTVMSGKV